MVVFFNPNTAIVNPIYWPWIKRKQKKSVNQQLDSPSFCTPSQSYPPHKNVHGSQMSYPVIDWWDESVNRVTLGEEAGEDEYDPQFS